MDKVMRWLAPHSAHGFVIRLICLIGVVTAANIVFATFAHDYEQHSLRYYLGHALFVGGPLIAFFLAVTVFQIRLQKKLWRLSRIDGLTGLYNRRTFFDLTARRRAENTAGVLLMLDADRFKAINDTYGHQAGDRCLKAIAGILRSNIRNGDVIGRIGGEEFAIYLNDITSAQARLIGERLTAPIPFQEDAGRMLTVTLSIGATIVQATASLDDMFSDADTALYRAKTKGRAQLVFWDETQQDEAATAAP